VLQVNAAQASETLVVVTLQSIRSSTTRTISDAPPVNAYSKTRQRELTGC
jgi:hypothetical protein